MKDLYVISTDIGTIWVVAESVQEAYKLLIAEYKKADVSAIVSLGKVLV